MPTHETIDLKALTIIKGAPGDAPEGRLFLPEDGEIILELKGEPAWMGNAAWTPDKYVVVEFMADIDSMARVELDFFEQDNESDEKNLRAGYGMIPLQRVKMAVKLDELSSKRFFIPTYPGAYKGHVSGEPTHISRMNRMRINLLPGRRCRSLTLYDLYLSDSLPDFTVIGGTMVDELGQYNRMEWEGKTHSEQELVDSLRSERERARTDCRYPEGWSRYGGWLQKKFEATGFFHTHHDGKRWWLVDPDGYAFFSNGCCYGSRMGVHGFVDRMENLFDWLPDKSDPVWKDCWFTADRNAEFVKRNGKEAGKNRYMFNFARANMIRAFGPDEWWNAWNEINGARFRRWGFNTIGVGVVNYPDERVMDYLHAVKIPYVWTLKEFPLTDTCIFRDFPDVYSPEYAERSAVFTRQMKAFVGDPYMIGYFITNEPEWLFQSSVILAERVLASHEPLASKDALIDFLRERYDGDITGLSKAWGLGLMDFDDLKAPIEHADRLSEAARKDLTDFTTRLVDMYSRVPSEALRAVDPDHMNLGMRYSSVPEGGSNLAGFDHFAAFSFNRYAETAVPTIERVAASSEKPQIIGEWHIGGSDKGLLANGLLSAENQTERGRALSYYLENAAAQPNLVGAHYFEFNDQPLLGRFDGECMQHGIIDVCNRAYDECLNIMIASNRKIYEIAEGTAAPTQVRGKLVPKF